MNNTQTKQKLVSIIIPVYNIGKIENYFKDAIKSIITQTYKNLEIIIIDDKSTDNTKELVEEFAAQDERIKLITNTHTKGISGALNTGLEASQGDYVARMDADDISLPDRITKQVDYLENNPDRVAVGCEMIIIDENSATIAEKKYSNNPKELHKMMFKYLPMPHPALMVRGDVYRECQYSEEYTTSEDVDLYFQLIKYGQFGNVKENLYKYRITSGSNSFKNIKSSLYNTIKARLAATKRYGYRPDLSGILYTFLQSILLLFPNKMVEMLYLQLRFSSHTDTKNREKLFEVIRFIIIGSLTVLIDWATFALVVSYTNINFAIADIANTPLVLGFNYLGHKFFTFRKPEFSWNELGKYFLVITYNQIEALVIMGLFIYLLDVDPIYSKILQILIMPIINFLMLKLFVFASTKQI